MPDGFDNGQWQGKTDATLEHMGERIEAIVEAENHEHGLIHMRLRKIELKQARWGGGIVALVVASGIVVPVLIKVL